MNSNFNDNFKSTRHGFTLVEMLFVIAIVAVVGAMTAGILGKAQKDAKFAATRSRITQIEAIMQTVNEDFEVRRMPVRISSGPALSRRAALNLRRQMAASILMAEFPGMNPGVPVTGLPAFTTAEMQFWENQPNVDQPGEYLYTILERINIDGSSALESLGPNVIGPDTDGDNIPVIVDAFGDQMELRILQVKNVTAEATNWKLTDADGLPFGYQLLAPTTAPSMNNIRFQVVSPNVEEVE